MALIWIFHLWSCFQRILFFTFKDKWSRNVFQIIFRNVFLLSNNHNFFQLIYFTDCQPSRSDQNGFPQPNNNVNSNSPNSHLPRPSQNGNDSSQASWTSPPPPSTLIYTRSMQPSQSNYCKSYNGNLKSSEPPQQTKPVIDFLF